MWPIAARLIDGAGRRLFIRNLVELMGLGTGVVCRIEGAVPTISVTFDDGPHPLSRPKILRALREHSIRATFFCVGENARKYPELGCGPIKLARVSGV
jgi:peptidoglycan/xylan/chitin deacetylase (PgdA/CDA1 family)